MSDRKKDASLEEIIEELQCEEQALNCAQQDLEHLEVNLNDSLRVCLWMDFESEEERVQFLSDYYEFLALALKGEFSIHVVQWENPMTFQFFGYHKGFEEQEHQITSTRLQLFCARFFEGQSAQKAAIQFFPMKVNQSEFEEKAGVIHTFKKYAGVPPKPVLSDEREDFFEAFSLFPRAKDASLDFLCSPLTRVLVYVIKTAQTHLDEMGEELRELDIHFLIHRVMDETTVIEQMMDQLREQMKGENFDELKLVNMAREIFFENAKKMASLPLLDRLNGEPFIESFSNAAVLMIANGADMKDLEELAEERIVPLIKRRSAVSESQDRLMKALGEFQALDYFMNEELKRLGSGQNFATHIYSIMRNALEIYVVEDPDEIDYELVLKELLGLVQAPLYSRYGPLFGFYADELRDLNIELASKYSHIDYSKDPVHVMAELVTSSLYIDITEEVGVWSAWGGGADA